MAQRRRKFAWETLGDEALLDVRLSDLGLRIEGTPLAERVERLHGELARKGLRFKPHVWLSSEWFSPDGVPGIAIPFYLAHPRLTRLERSQMFEVEGGTEVSCMRLLRHEAGHAIDTAFRLHRRKLWRSTFGSFTAPYDAAYMPRPYSRRFVVHLDLWYAQSHPAEDFAETFAVWLTPRAEWRKRYARWPALKKLEAVDRMMGDIAGQPQAVRCREQTERLTTLRTTLREHYAKKRERYAADPPEMFDPLLRRLFPAAVDGAPAGRRAAAFLRGHRAELRRAVSTWTGLYRYSIDQVLAEMIDRAAELELDLFRDEAEALSDATVVLTIMTMNHMHGGSFKLAR